MIYRYRTIEQLLDKHNELLNQEIYFAPPEDLNDAMEGFSDVCWQGDAIVWKNLLRQYLRSLERVFCLNLILKSDSRLAIEHIPDPCLSDRPKTEKERLMREEIESSFFNREYVTDLPVLLASRNSPVRKNELISYLRTLHLIALQVISEVYNNQGLISQKYDLKYQSSLEKMISDLKDGIERTNTLAFEDADAFFMAISMTSVQLSLGQSYNWYLEGVSHNRYFLLSEFPEAFVQKLEKSAFPNWYSASFLSACENSSLWGYYVKHNGVCLEFKTSLIQNQETLQLAPNQGNLPEKEWSNWTSYRFHNMSYDKKFPEIDFFRSIGKLSTEEVKRQWYCNEKGDESVCAAHLANDKQKEWREKYWDNFYARCGTKLNDWRFEGESRLIIVNGLYNYNDKDTRKLKYRFSDLNGIIFGINTPIEKKHEIMQIIEKKCKETGRSNFAFYQAYYSKKTGKIKKHLMSLLKFD